MDGPLRERHRRYTTLGHALLPAGLHNSVRPVLADAPPHSKSRRSAQDAARDHPIDGFSSY